MTPNASWYAEGLRWIGSLFTGAVDYLSRPSLASLREPRHPEHLDVHEYVLDVRHRMQNRL